MNHPNGARSRVNQPGLGRSSTRFIHSVDNQPSVSMGVNVVTPAQAYANAMGAGHGHSRALNHTIERRQPEEKGQPPPPLGILQLGGTDSKSSDRGLSFAQRLYASALSNKNPVLSSSLIAGTQPTVGHASSSALPRGSSRPRKPDTISESLQFFNPSDLYYGHAATQGFLSRSATHPEGSSKRHSPLNTLPVTRRSYYSISQASGSSSQNSISRPEAQNPRPVSHSFQRVKMEAQPSRSAAFGTQASGLPEASAGTHQGFHSPTAADETIPSLSPLLQQFLNLPSSSPPPLAGHGTLSGLPEEFVADINDIASMAPPLTPPAPHEDNLSERSFHTPSEVIHEEIPSYSLVDEQLPPPAFDDLRNEISAAAD